MVKFERFVHVILALVTFELIAHITYNLSLNEEVIWLEFFHGFISSFSKPNNYVTICTLLILLVDSNDEISNKRYTIQFIFHVVGIIGWVFTVITLLKNRLSNIYEISTDLSCIASTAILTWLRYKDNEVTESDLAIFVFPSVISLIGLTTLFVNNYLMRGHIVVYPQLNWYKDFCGSNVNFHLFLNILFIAEILWKILPRHLRKLRKDGPLTSRY